MGNDLYSKAPENSWWEVDLKCKPDFNMSMKRIYAWFEGEIIDRPPVRFTAHNSFVNQKFSNYVWANLKDKWFDVEFQVKSFMELIKGRKFLGETFPVYWPNLGPNIFSSFYGSELVFSEVTSWAEPCINDLEGVTSLELDYENPYFKKIDELTTCALELCQDNFLVGYTDLHPGVDCVAAWRGIQSLCMDFYDNPDKVKIAIQKASIDFQKIFNYFDTKLKNKNQLSVTWMEIPSFGKMHIPSCDFSAFISKSHFEEYCLPTLQNEVKPMTHNIFHLDGKDVARHLDMILEVPEIKAIQWVQGVGEDKPIMQWIPLIKKIRIAGKSVLVDLEVNELEDFISSISPDGIMLCLPISGEGDQEDCLKRVAKW